ncbi:MAG: phytanoyl-CoA dioxygenase family protein, partial [Planctomycetota bacterium]|nr:phytanoyl-CoA dioxygenase family protein [Planctomycetota bacterium]
MRTLSRSEMNFFRTEGYLLIEKVFGESEMDELRSCYDHIAELAGNPALPEIYRSAATCDVHFHIQAPEEPDPSMLSTFLRKVQWPAMFHMGFERFRLSPKLLTLVEPLIGSSLKQFINQINFKMPGGAIEFPWHQDIRPTPAFQDQVNNYVQTIIAVDTATVERGCVNIVPGSHTLGDLKAKRYAPGQIEQHVDVSTAVACEAPAGSVILFTPYTVHGSTQNLSSHPRRSYINGFVRASSCSIGKWAFLDGRGVPITSDHDYGELCALLNR